MSIFSTFPPLLPLVLALVLLLLLLPLLSPPRQLRLASMLAPVLGVQDESGWGSR